MKRQNGSGRETIMDEPANAPGAPLESSTDLDMQRQNGSSRETIMDDPANPPSAPLQSSTDLGMRRQNGSSRGTIMDDPANPPSAPLESSTDLGMRRQNSSSRETIMDEPANPPGAPLESSTDLDMRQNGSSRETIMDEPANPPSAPLESSTDLGTRRQNGSSRETIMGEPANPPGAPLAVISVRDWIEACRDPPRSSSFIASAVDLAWMLTNRLSEIIESFPAELRLEDHITPDNVAVYVWRPSSARGDIERRAPTVVDAKFYSLPAWTEGDAGSLPPDSGAVCAALGRVLLEIFSRGSSASLEETTPRPASLEETTLRADSEAVDSDCPPENHSPSPVGKRQATNTVSGTNAKDLLISSGMTVGKRQATNTVSGTNAKNLLISSGVPLSVCQLVCDLLDAANNAGYTSPRPDNFEFASLKKMLDSGEEPANSALTSIREARWDLSGMRDDPRRFLFDRTCPRGALDDTRLFRSNADDARLIGRGDEMRVLMTAKDNISLHVRGRSTFSDTLSGDDGDFLCDALFLCGYAGSGKSSLIQALAHSCEADRWFVLSCKFSQQSAPHMILANAFNDFFGRRLDSGKIPPFDDVCSCILRVIDSEGLKQLCDIVPNFSQFCPGVDLGCNDNDDWNVDKAGCAQKRLQNLFHVVLESILSAGYPVLFVLDDLQWSESFVIECVADFFTSSVRNNSKCVNSPRKRGLVIAGAFRSNGVEKSNGLTSRINALKESGSANVTLMNISELSKASVLRLVSFKLCLPWRYTRDLAEIVHVKTRGNPFFVVQFLRSAIQNKMLSFSVKYRRWIWDNDALDTQIISAGVAQLLTSSFGRLPSTLMRALEIISCLGFQVEESIIAALDSGDGLLPFNIRRELLLAVNEGVLETAGPLYQFTHDIVHETVYKLISPNDRISMHYAIGKKLLEFATDNPSIHTLATDQINTFCKDGNPSPEERSLFAHINATAAHFAIAASSFGQARSYIDAGIQLLENRHWDSMHYSLSLELFEMSASVSWIHGDLAKTRTCLNDIMSHAKDFDDTLKASILHAKLLAANSEFEQLQINCLMTLRNLGETFPSEFDIPFVLNEISSAQPALENITISQIKQLPQMKDRNKLNAMKFMNLLSMHSVISNPMLIPILSRRMVKLTMEYGFCEDSVVGLASIGLAIFHFTADVELASRIGKVSESLIEESPKKHVLRSRLCRELVFVLKLITEPIPSVIHRLPEVYTSAMMVGDVENVMVCRWNHCALLWWLGQSDLFSLEKQFSLCINEATKHQQYTAVHMTMVNCNTCTSLSGRAIAGTEIKSIDELDEIGFNTGSSGLVWQAFMSRMASYFWMREYKKLVELSDAYSAKHSSSPKNRILNVYRTLIEGVAHFNLARDTKEAKWMELGKKAVAFMSKMESMSTWNFENKSKLLQAELYYADGDHASAEDSYKASIESARQHKLVHEEALALELYGIFCIKNKLPSRGMEQLNLALDKYKQWKAMKKVEELERFTHILGH